MGYEPNLTDMYKRAAAPVDKILKGAKLADLPIEFPTRIEFIISRPRRRSACQRHNRCYLAPTK